MKLSGNNEYAKVATRVLEFVRQNPNSNITTEVSFQEGNSIATKSTFTSVSAKDVQVIFRAKITPDVANPEHYFTGTSFGSMSQNKALEKLETVAVGRALAFAGYCANGEIATDEEMENYTESKKIPASEVDDASKKLRAAKSYEELGQVWYALPQTIKECADVFELKESLKQQYETIRVEPTNGGMEPNTSGQNNGDVSKTATGLQNDPRVTIL